MTRTDSERTFYVVVAIRPGPACRCGRTDKHSVAVYLPAPDHERAMSWAEGRVANAHTHGMAVSVMPTRHTAHRVLDSA